MTSRQKIENLGVNLNTIILLITLIGAIFTGVWFLYPLNTLPQDVQKVQTDLHQMQNTQSVQTEALKTLAEVAKDSRDLRRDFDRSSAQIEAKNREQDHELDAVQKRLERIEQR